MHRLQPVAHVGQGARHDHAHRVIEIRAPHLLFDRDRRDVGAGGGGGAGGDEVTAKSVVWLLF